MDSSHLLLCLLHTAKAVTHEALYGAPFKQYSVASELGDVRLIHNCM